MTAMPPGSPAPSARQDGAPGPARDLELPVWTELADALYLAACQDAAVPLFDEPGRTVRDRGRQPRRAGHRTGERTPAGEPDSRRPGTAPGTEERPPVPSHPAFRAIPAQNRPLQHAPSAPVLPEATDPGTAGWPAPPRLAESLALARSMRPLCLTRASPHHIELDEETTAERAAVSGLWMPVCRPVPERLLDLLLLVDSSPSMAVWSSVVRQTAELMEQTAAFRTVRLVGWSPDTDPPTGVPGAEIRSAPRQLLLVVTDGGHSAWRTGHAASALNRLGRSSPVAVLSLLPQHLWDLTLPTVAPTRLRAPSPAAPNRAYEIAEEHRHADSPGPLPDGGHESGQGGLVPVPVVELRPTALERWTRLAAAAGGSGWHRMAALWTAPGGDLRSATADPQPGRLPDLLAAPAGDGEGDAGSAESPAVRQAERAVSVVRRFRATASPTTYALAQRLAAAPLSLPVMRLLTQSLPGAQLWNLSEIVLLGLVRRVDAAADAEDPHSVSFDFEEGVREELLALSTRAETLRALRHVQRHLGPRLEALWGESGAALVAPEGDHTDPLLTEQTRPFIAHLYTALCSVSGPYLARADRLGGLLQRAGPRSAASHGTPAADTTRTPGRKPPSAQPHSRGVMSELRKDRLTYPYRNQAEEETEVRFPADGPPATPTSAKARSTSLPPRQGGTPVIAGSPVASGPQAPRVWGNVPQRNRNFTGREILLEKLQERLGGGVAAVLPEALHGMGGVGKSQIAVEYVYRHSREYRLVWWIASEQENQIVQSLVELGEKMGLQAGPELSAVPAVLEALRRGEPYADWLLVFDNAEDPRTVRKYFPSDGPGGIVVTSRNSQWSTDFSSLEVDVFTREESVALLRRRSQHLPDEAVNHLAAALGDLPLAVEQAAVWLAETGMPVQQYLEVYERNFTELMQSDPPSDYNRSVAAAWNVSLGRLRETRPDALQLLQVCAFFAPEPIEWELFSAVRGISAPRELQAALDDPVKLGRAVREIGRYALARIDHRQSTLLMHRLVQRVLIEQMNPQEQAAMRHAAHQLLAHADPRNPERSVFWPKYSSLLSHLRASEAVVCRDGWTRRLVLNEVRFLAARGDHAGALDLARQASDAWRQELGEDHEDVLAVDQQIAETLRVQGTSLHDAYELQSGLVGRYSRTLGEAHEDTLRAQSYLAIHHRNRGHFEEAREIDERVFQTSIREFGMDDPATLLAAHNYAVSLRLAGDSEQAVELDYDTWQRRIEVLGEDHIRTLGTREAYLLDLQEVGRYREASEGYEVLAAEIAGPLGEQHPFVALVNRNWCVALRKMGDHQGAYALSSKYLQVISDNLGIDSRHYLLIAASHANDLRQVGKLEESRALNEQALQQNRKWYGRDHPHSYAIAMNLAVTLRLLGQAEAALALDQESVEGLALALPQGHPRTLLARMNLASDHFALGHPEQAHSIDEAVAEETERLRENHPANLAVRLNLSYDLKALGRTEEGEALYSETKERYRSVLGPSHPATLDAQKGLRANGDIDLLVL
jgi:tetratricopeptide (TPR) repeat protein